MDDAMRADDERDDDEGWIGRPTIDRSSREGRAPIARVTRWARRATCDAT